MSARVPPVIEVITAVEGWCALERRSPTLDGSLPLRVVQGCLPMLDGTALGLQVSLHVPLRAHRTWRGWSLSPLAQRRRVERWGLDADSAHDGDALRRAARRATAAAPALFAHGLLDPAWRERLRAPLAEIVRSRTTSTIRLWTGLLAKVAADARLVALRASPRRALGVDAEPAVIPAHGRWAPVILELALDPRVDEVILQGEVATLAVLPARVPVRFASLDEAPQAGRALLDFYDAHYFSAKRDGEVTRKYRRLVADAPEPASEGEITVVACGPPEVDVCALAGGDGPTALAVRCGVRLDARFDGQRVWIDADADALSARRDAIERAWAPLAAADDPAHRGALWYLTKYMTPHPAGEPHFFTKPCALVVTPPGWSTLVEGVAVPGVGETLRGLVHTDQFHAVPSVFALPTAARSGRIDRGVTLSRMLPLPRAWASPTVCDVPFSLR